MRGAPLRFSMRWLLVLFLVLCASVAQAVDADGDGQDDAVDMCPGVYGLDGMGCPCSGDADCDGHATGEDYDDNDPLVWDDPGGGGEGGGECGSCCCAPSGDPLPWNEDWRVLVLMLLGLQTGIQTFGVANKWGRE